MEYIKYIQDEEHYNKVIEKAASVKKSLQEKHEALHFLQRYT